jgi:hypothetical protein
MYGLQVSGKTSSVRVVWISGFDIKFYARTNLGLHLIVHLI